jgi:hypothetical protein
MTALKGNGYFFTPRIGIYDMWAIRYGYTEIKAQTPTEERYALSQIANQSGKPGLAYMTDENADSWDPYVQRFDYASDPLEYLNRTLYACKVLRQYAIEKLPRPGESYNERTTWIMSSINQTFTQCLAASSFIGGIRSGRFHKGDIGARATLVPVDPALQRKALNLIIGSCFSTKSFQIPSQVLETMSLDPDSTTGSSWNAPIRRYLVLRSSAILSALLRSDLLSRISENEIKVGLKNKCFTLDELLSGFVNSIYSEIGKNLPVSPTRRDLQKVALTSFILVVNGSSDASGNDAKSILTDRLKELHSRLSVQIKHTDRLDRPTVSHLKDLKEALGRFLNRISMAK